MAQKIRFITTQQSYTQAMRRLVLAGVIGPLFFIAAYLFAGALRPGYSPIHQVISDLGIGPHAWLLNASAIIAGLLLMAFSVGFAFSMRAVLAPVRRWLGAILLSLHGLGLVIAGIFTEAPATLTIHWLIGADLAFFGPVVALLVIGLTWRRHAQWRWWGNLTLFAGLVILVVIAFTFWIFTPGTPLAPAHLGGLMERILLLTIESWYVVIGWRLISFAGPQLSDEHSFDR